jgi:hypothetical protein
MTHLTALRDRVWRPGEGWAEDFTDRTFGERLGRALDCQAGYPDCEFDGLSHQHDLAETIHGHVLTLYVSDPENAMGASGMFLAHERGPESSPGASLHELADHLWADHPEYPGHCFGCQPSDDPYDRGRCNPMAHFDVLPEPADVR